MRALLLGLVGLLALPALAEARMHHPYRGHRILPSGGVVDGIGSAPLEAYSFRKVKQSYAGPGVKLRRTTGGTSDINFTAGGDLDVAQAATFCAATTCFLDTVYDQSGGNRHLLQASAADQPAYVADCGNGRPCMRLDATDWMQSATSASATTGVMTISGVAKRTAGTGAANLLQPAGGSNLTFYPSPGFMAVYPGPGLTATAAENRWHAAIGIINGASSTLEVDGSGFPGTQATSPTSAQPVMGSAAGTAFDWAEAIAWNAYVLTPAERLALTQNQQNYWFPLPLDNLVVPSEAYSLRRLKSTYTGPAIQLRRASDGLTQDINFLGYVPGLGAPIDTAAANAFCAATTCTLQFWYDQSGNGRHAAQNPPVQPTYVANCIGTLPCVREIGGGGSMASPTGLSSAGGGSLSAVARRSPSGGNDFCIVAGWYWGGSTPNRLFINNDATYWVADGGGGTTVFQSSDNWAFHAVAATYGPPGGGVLRIDGAEGPGTAAGTPTTGYFVTAQAGGGAHCDTTELIHWDAYMMSAAERAATTTNQRNFWGLP